MPASPRWRLDDMGWLSSAIPVGANISDSLAACNVALPVNASLVDTSLQSTRAAFKLTTGYSNGNSAIVGFSAGSFGSISPAPTFRGRTLTYLTQTRGTKQITLRFSDAVDFADTVYMRINGVSFKCNFYSAYAGFIINPTAYNEIANATSLIFGLHT